MAFGQLLAYAGWFFLCVNALRSRHDIRSVCWVIVGTACAMAILGILQEASGTDMIYWIRDTSYATDRFFGPYINRNHFAGYQAMAIILGLGLLLTQPVRARREASLRWRHRLIHWFGFLSPGRLLLTFALSLMSGAMVMAASRGGILSLFCGLLGLGFLLHQHQLRSHRRMVLMLSLVAMVGMGLWLGTEPLLKRFEQLTANAWAGRLPAFQAAWEISKDFPLVGIGYDAFPVVSARYQPVHDINQRFVHVHNDYLQLLAETGWIGAGLLVGGMLSLVRAMVLKWRMRRDPFVQTMAAAGMAALVAMGLHSLVDFNLHIPANALLFTTVLALTFTCAHLSRRGSSDELEGGAVQRASRGRIAGLAALALLIICGLGMHSMRLAVADLLYPQEQVWQPDHWVHRVTPTVERQRLQQAMRWTPANPWYGRQLAGLEAQAARMGQASDDTTQATRQLTVETLQRAAHAYEQALQQQPTDPYTQLDWLNVKLRLMHLQPPAQPPSLADLEALYRRIASLAPAHANVQYALGVAILTAETDGLATVSPRPFFRQAIELDANYIPQILGAYLRLLPDGEARQRFAGTLPNTAQAHQQAARLLERSHWQQSHLHYQTALILGQSDPEILKAYAAALMRQKEFDEARDIWQRLQAEHPDQAEAYLGLATVLHHLKDHEGVVQTLQQLVARFPQNVSYQSQLAQAYGRQNRLREAEMTWKMAIDLQPHEAQSYVGLAQLYASQNMMVEAIPMMQRAIQIAPDHLPYQQVLARFYELNGNREQAIQSYQRLASRSAADPHAFYKLGTYAQEQGQLTRAVAYYRRAVHLKPDYLPFQRALKMALQQAAQHE
jgi:tetratricopeptide (TPR) repeat protein/O-antigen ligase